MKLLGSAFLIASGLLWGLSRFWELARRERLLLELQRLMQSLETGIRCSARPLGELLAQESSPFCQGEGASPQEAMLQAGGRLLRRREDLALYKGFVAGLGATDSQGQQHHIGLYAAQLAHLLEGARLEREKQGRLSISLGLFAGITASILLM